MVLEDELEANPLLLCRADDAVPLPRDLEVESAIRQGLAMAVPVEREPGEDGHPMARPVDARRAHRLVVRLEELRLPPSDVVAEGVVRRPVVEREALDVGPRAADEAFARVAGDVERLRREVARGDEVAAPLGAHGHCDAVAAAAVGRVADAPDVFAIMERRHADRLRARALDDAPHLRRERVPRHAFEAKRYLDVGERAAGRDAAGVDSGRTRDGRQARRDGRRDEEGGHCGSSVHCGPVLWREARRARRMPPMVTGYDDRPRGSVKAAAA